MARRTLRSLVGVVLLSCAAPPLPVDAATHPTTREPASSCHQAAAEPPWYLPGGWRIQCTPRTAIDGNYGRTYEHLQLILIADDISPEQTQITLAHEAAHAESARWPKRYQLHVAKLLGKPSWNAGPYAERPIEVYAENRARCAGYSGADRRWPRLDCVSITHIAAYGYYDWTHTLPPDHRPYLEWTSDRGQWHLWWWDPARTEWFLFQ